jgi:hypothetical protein
MKKGRAPPPCSTSPWGVLGEGVLQEKVFALTPSPNLFPKGERNLNLSEPGG